MQPYAGDDLSTDDVGVSGFRLFCRDYKTDVETNTIEKFGGDTSLSSWHGK